MDNTNLLNEGFTLMVFGVSFVFVFLTLLVFATSIMSWLITKYEKNVGGLPEDGIPSPTAVINPVKHASSQEFKKDDASLVSVLSAAVHKFRSRNK